MSMWGLYFVYGVPVVGVIMMQMFLSRKENKWLGLVSPIISFGVNLLYILMGVWIANRVGITMLYSGTGEEYNFTWFAVQLFFRNSIATVILLILYALCRGKRHKQRYLAKMSVQDLG